MQTRIHFGPFVLNRETEELRKAGSPIRLRPQAFKVLAFLADRAGKLVPREDIRHEVWPGGLSVQFELGINRCIKEIRSALGDDADQPRYIDTVHRRGYRFIAPIYEEKPALDTKPRQLTTHSHEASIVAAAISPDGQYLAYADDSAVYLKIITNGELQPLRALEGYRISYLSWFPDGSKLLASGTRGTRGDDSVGVQNGVEGIWAVSIFDRLLWKLANHAGEAAAFGEGSRVAFIGEDGKEVWVARTGSEERAQRVYTGSSGDRLGDLAWIADGQMLLFRRLHIGEYQFEVRLECLHLATGRVSRVLSEPRLRGSCVLEDGRLICALAGAAPRQSDVNLWEFRIDPRTAQVIGEPRRVTNWPGIDVRCLSAARGGKRLAFLQGPHQADVYVGELREGGKALAGIRRLTLDDRNDLPTAWTHDSKSVLFHSDRHGKWEIFKQDLSSRNAELIISAVDDCRAARISADGDWIVYLARNRDRMWSWAEPLRLMRAPMAGGPSSVVLSERRLYSVRCARSPSHLCALGDRRLKQFIFYVLDPIKGRGAKIATVAVDIPWDQSHWDVSPDGSRIAVLTGAGLEGTIRILSLADGSVRDVIVSGWNGFQSMDWAANGQGLYVSSHSAMHSSLLHIDLNGYATLLRQQVGNFETWGIPSPDGRYLAFLEWSSISNVWMMELPD